jgi:hypothetical protein
MDWIDSLLQKTPRSIALSPELEKVDEVEA